MLQPTDRASQTRCEFGTIVFDTGCVEASKGCLESWGVHGVGGAAIAGRLGDGGWHFLPRKAKGASGENELCSDRQSRPGPFSNARRVQTFFRLSRAPFPLRRQPCADSTPRRSQSQREGGSYPPVERHPNQPAPIAAFRKCRRPKLIPTSAAAASSRPSTMMRIPDEGRTSVSAISTRAPPMIASACRSSIPATTSGIHPTAPSLISS